MKTSMIAIAALAVAAVAAPHARAAGPATVTIDEFTYAPARLTVPVGTTVTWLNGDEEPHTVTSTTAAFASAGLGHGESFARTFDRPGTYPYFCALHPHMRAVVVVQ